MSIFEGKTLLITGGTGSFGNAVLKRFLNTDIGEIRIFSRDEKKQDDMRKKYNNDKLKFYIGDVRNPESLDSVMHGVDYIFHAAALKQVPSCEFFPMEAVRTNVVGTNNVLNAAVKYGVKRIVCLSTDKAAYPINAMGISKAMMEKVIRAKAREVKNTGTVISCTRYEFFPMEAVRTNVVGTNNVLNAAVKYGVKRIVCLSTDKAAYPINAMGISKAMMEKVIRAKAREVKNTGTVISCTRYGNVMCSRGSVIPLFIDQIRAGKPITITDPNMTRFLMNLDEAVDLVLFAFEHAKPGDLFIQKADASTIEDLAKGVQKLFGETGVHVIGTRHGEKLYETLMTREERLNSEDMGNYFRISADERDINYDKYFVNGDVKTQSDEAYTSHNTVRLDVDGVVKKILTTDYVQNALKGIFE